MSARAAALGLAGTAVLVGGWLLAPADQPPDDTPEDAGTAEPASEEATGALDSQQPPDDLDQANKVAAEFALALTTGDLEQIGRLATDDYADTLTGTQARSAPEQTGVEVDGIVTQNLQPDQVTLDVLLAQPDGALVKVTLALARGEEGWRVVDGA